MVPKEHIIFPENWFIPDDTFESLGLKVVHKPKRLPNGDYIIDVEPIGMTTEDVIKQLMPIK